MKKRYLKKLIKLLRYERDQAEDQEKYYFEQITLLEVMIPGSQEFEFQAKLHEEALQNTK